MPHERGAYLGGIRTVADLRARCRVDDDTGCWHWSMGFSQGSPRIHLALDGRNTAMRGRRAALLLARGKDVRPGLVVFARLQCRSADCVNPAHCRAGTRQQHGEWQRLSGTGRTPAKQVGAVKGWTVRPRRFTPEQVHRIRNGSESVAALAREFGVAMNSIHQVRTFKTYRTVRAEVPGASVFSWRPAA
jgi:hypothetical protein